MTTTNSTAMSAGEKARKAREENRCPYCDAQLRKWVPSHESSWGPQPHLVCFNDDCPYFKNGWDWMQRRFQQNASYRFRFNPQNNEVGPLPVWSADALKTGIIE